MDFHQYVRDHLPPLAIAREPEIVDELAQHLPISIAKRSTTASIMAPRWRERPPRCPSIPKTSRAKSNTPAGRCPG